MDARQNIFWTAMGNNRYGQTFDRTELMSSILPMCGFKASAPQEVLEAASVAGTGSVHRSREMCRNEWKTGDNRLDGSVQSVQALWSVNNIIPRC